jgi:hypothetical protein
MSPEGRRGDRGDLKQFNAAGRLTKRHGAASSDSQVNGRADGPIAVVSSGDVGRGTGVKEVQGIRDQSSCSVESMDVVNGGLLDQRVMRT